MNIVILAAGQGKRMGPAQPDSPSDTTQPLPKVLHHIAGRPMLSHVLGAVRAAAIGLPANIVVVVGHGAKKVQETFLEVSANGSELRFVEQHPQLGTGHAVQQAVPLLDDDARTLVLFGDVPLVSSATLRRLIDARVDVALLTVQLAQPAGYGRVVRDTRGNVMRIVEERDATEGERQLTEVNTGILIAPTARLKHWLGALSNNNAQGEYYLPDVVAHAVAEGCSVAAVQAADAEETLGVNSKEQLAMVERIAQRRAASALMERGVTLADPARIEIRGTLDVGADVSIDVGCVFEGKVSLANGVRIGAYCVLRDCSIGAGTDVLPFCYLESATVGAAARIGPYSRLRPGAHLGDEVHVGNFVEVKASTLGRGSKANHLAYIGDAVVGANVNIGAGTITANYDGAHKHRTVIEDDVSIGSNAVLVAPVTIGKGATIAGGSTISRNAPAGKLTVGRAKQTTLDGWKRPVKAKQSGEK
ncbi:MAG: bifunctional UDP-N-acetylglucosamine diphosphorylase/glucosamine-1-phosphate N-acetyltransferase GlmU [Burkholderiaceae bacterium]|nr:bifunctional UDP-N-acetylglucosamine diphosphorylase/glucosamine-1-phosphate N-acetyltransferase GlmU [Burkholderiaceae bacterium]